MMKTENGQVYTEMENVKVCPENGECPILSRKWRMSTFVRKTENVQVCPENVHICPENGECPRKYCSDNVNQLSLPNLIMQLTFIIKVVL
jgi:hypothetical protein